jgi:hypothetical protein
MEEETGMEETPVLRESTETGVSGKSQSVESRRGPTWRGWVLSLLVAILLSVTATLILGGYGSFRAGRTVAGGAGGIDSGAGRSCCPPAYPGK